VSEGRKTVRRLVTVLTALLLATALAAGAGDNVKWVRSALLPCFSVDADVAASDDDFAAVLARYTLGWKSSRRNAAIGHVAALFYGWEVYCARLRREAAEKGAPAYVVQAKAEEERKLFARALVFFVAVAARDEADANLADPSRWEIYLLWDGARQNPNFLGEPEAALRDIIVRPISTHDAHGTPGGARAKTRPPPADLDAGENGAYRKIYKVAFDNPWGEAPRGSVKLVVACEKARRGFEWRFKE
jgi:hypothetical protein